MRPLHFTALSSRSGAPPHHPYYLHHNAMRKIQVDLLLKMDTGTYGNHQTKKQPITATGTTRHVPGHKLH